VKSGLQRGQQLGEQEAVSRSLPVSVRSFRPVLLALAVALAVAIGILEYAMGYDFHVTALFLVPTCWAGWAVSRRAGYFLALVCAAIWLGADLTMGHPYKHPAIPYWNGLMLLAFFGLIVYLLCAFQDVHKKLLEAQFELQHQNERLEETVRQRTAALEAEIAERERLEKAKLQAERLAMVGTIAAQVAHEVRNPLGSITLNLDLIAKEITKLGKAGPFPVQEGHTLVNEMREEVRRIQRVIEDYLRFARLPKLHRKPVNLNDLLKKKLSFMDLAFQNALVELDTEFDLALKTINADPEQLWQAILNLLQNSLEAMPAGGTVAVSTRCENGQALLRVTDTGRGMTEEQQEHLYVPFFTTKPGGTGLGLPLTQRILNEHGARIECASSAGSGSTFTIYFPLEERS
jgi:signal transduction histidine kinase